MILYALCIVLIQRFCPLQVEPNERCKKGYRHKRYRPRNNLGREGHLARALMKGTRGELELSLFVCLLRCFHRPLSLVGRAPPRPQTFGRCGGKRLTHRFPTTISPQRGGGGGQECEGVVQEAAKPAIPSPPPGLIALVGLLGSARVCRSLPLYNDAVGIARTSCLSSSRPEGFEVILVKSLIRRSILRVHNTTPMWEVLGKAFWGRSWSV
jgi:hypothetical protein